MRHHGSWQAADFPVLEDWHVTLGLQDVEERTPRFTVQRGQYRETAALSRDRQPCDEERGQRLSQDRSEGYGH
jgi:hypothetical protein